MTVEAFATSPLAHRARDLAVIEAAEVSLLRQVDLRMDPALTSRSSLAFPSRPNTYATGPTAEVLWLGPDEWLIVSPAQTTDGLIADLEQALADEHNSLVDVSAARAVLELTAPDALEIVSKGCGLDLHSRSWHAGDCAQTLLARVPVILQQRGDATRIFVRPSFGDYLVDWLFDARAG